MQIRDSHVKTGYDALFSHIHTVVSTFLSTSVRASLKTEEFFSCLLVRKYFNESYYYLDESVGTSTPAPSIMPDWDLETSSGGGGGGGAGGGGGGLEGRVGSVSVRSAIPAHLFVAHVAALHAGGDAGFRQEYAALQAAVAACADELAAASSKDADNKFKNRYHNVVACECGVILPALIETTE